MALTPHHIYLEKFMSYSSCDLHTDLDRQLADLGFHITEDDDDTGWGYAFGASDSAPDLTHGLDSAAEASNEALCDLVGRVDELRSAARLVVERWSKERLDEAVRALDGACRQLEPEAAPSTSAEEKTQVLQRRLQALEAAGLTFSDCLQVFGVPTDSHPLARAAVLARHEEGELEFDERTVVSESEDGAYVLAWVWQPG